jgi:SAM-dependent methyltransferase
MTSRAPGQASDASSALRFNTDRSPDHHRPSLTHRYRYYTRALAQELRRRIPELGLGSGSRILDYGCANLPYRHLFPAEAAYMGADLAGNPDAVLQLNEDGTLPVPDGGFDAILSTQVLEHVTDPGLYLRECFRVLEPGGKVLLSTHGMFVYHPDPQDLWRWTSDGLSASLRDIGFEVTRVEGVVGLLPMGLQFVQDAIYWKLPRPLRTPLVVVMQTIIGLTDRLHDAASRRRNASVYVVTAEKP